MSVASARFRIALIPATWPADAADFTGTFYRDQAMALAAAGHQVTVLALRTVPWRIWLRHGIDCRVRIARENNMDVLRLALPELPLGSYRWRRRLWLWGTAYLWRAARARGDQPDIIHAHCAIYAGMAAARLKQASGVPCVLTEHNSAYLTGQYNNRLQDKAARAMAACDARLCVSPALATVLAGRLGVSDWEYVPNVLGARFVELDPSSARCGFRFLNLAAMHEAKQQILLLDAFAQSFPPQVDADVELVIAGEGPQREALVQRARTLGILERVRFPGKLEPGQVPAFMQSGDCFLLSSRYETFGVVLIEALACGLPLIATRCGGPEAIVNEDNGQLVPVGDVVAMAAAMQQAYARRDDVDHEALARKAVAVYGPAAIAERLSTIYRRVLSARSA